MQGMLQHEAGGPSSQAYRGNTDDPAEVSCAGLQSWSRMPAAYMFQRRLTTAVGPALQANALTSPVWELTLLSKHYHPHVAAASAQLTAGGPAPQLPLGGSAAAFAASYTTAGGAFNPAPRTRK